MAGPYILFFEWDSAKLDAQSLAILDVTLDNFRDCEVGGLAVEMTVEGHSDTSEAESLSVARADVVHRYFTDHDVPEKQIRASGLGASRLRVATGPGVRQLQNRRTEVMFGPLR